MWKCFVVRFVVPTIWPCNQKEGVRNHTALWLPARPKASMSSWSFSHTDQTFDHPTTLLTVHMLLIFYTQLKPLIIPQHIDCLVMLTDTHCKTRDVLALLPLNNRTEFTKCISCLYRSHNFQPKKFFSFQTMYIAREHKLLLHQNVHETSDAQCCLLIHLSLSWILLQ